MVYYGQSVVHILALIILSAIIMCVHILILIVCELHLRRNYSLLFLAGQVFLKEPQNYTAYQAQLNDNVTFDCVVNTSTAWCGLWNVSGMCIEVPCNNNITTCPLAAMHDESLCCPYILNTNLENNGTDLTCLAASNCSCNESTVFRTSNPVEFQIQGN